MPTDHVCLVSAQATPNITPALDPEFRPAEVVPDGTLPVVLVVQAAQATVLILPNCYLEKMRLTAPVPVAAEGMAVEKELPVSSSSGI